MMNWLLRVKCVMLIPRMSICLDEGERESGVDVDVELLLAMFMLFILPLWFADMLDCSVLSIALLVVAKSCE